MSKISHPKKIKAGIHQHHHHGQFEDGKLVLHP
jgi:hypothetical protein